jgi:hypothetical protein
VTMPTLTLPRIRDPTMFAARGNPTRHSPERGIAAPRLRYGSSRSAGRTFSTSVTRRPGKTSRICTHWRPPVTPRGSIRSPTPPTCSARSAPAHKTASTNSCRIFCGRRTSQPSRRRLPDSHRDHWLRGCTSSVGRLHSNCRLHLC